MPDELSDLADGLAGAAAGALSADPRVVAATPAVTWKPAGQRGVRGFEAPVEIASARP